MEGDPRSSCKLQEWSAIGPSVIREIRREVKHFSGSAGGLEPSSANDGAKVVHERSISTSTRNDYKAELESCMDGCVQLIGLTEVYKPSKDVDHTVDIVLVHGLFGRPHKTWTCRTAADSSGVISDDEAEQPPCKKRRTHQKELLTEVFWPRDLLPLIIPQARVFTWGYDVQIDHLLKAPSKASVFHHAQTLLSDVALQERPGSKKPLIFIAHSLGGIVVKDALSISRDETTFVNEVLPRTLGVVFLGTPHKGSKVASLGKIAFELSKCFLKDPNTKILRALEVDSEVLERISRSFGLVLNAGQVKVHSFREEMSTGGTMIVDSFSASIGYLHETTSTLHANHRTMAKYASAEDTNFIRLTSVISRWIEEIDSNKPEDLKFTSVRRVPEVPDALIFDDQYNQCIDSLDDVQARVRFENVESAWSNTYEWLFSPRVGFEGWLQGQAKSPIFWISGKPGSGKSTLMKYAMTHHETLTLLHSHRNCPSIIAGYFFHDRGTKVQKSIEGFLAEILFQMLSDHRQLFTYVFEGLSEQAGKRESLRDWSSWTTNDYRVALLAIASKSSSPLNCCLFVDALDEAEDDHRRLVSTLTELANLPSNPSFSLRLCLAGRPENILSDAFRQYPGFRIHDHTTADMHHYASDRIRLEYLGLLTETGKEQVQLLVDDVLGKAEGVFLWVRLVVSEMVEGLCSGDSLEEMRDQLAEIPTELDELYTRTLRRTRRNSSVAASKQSYETYVLFQIVAQAIEPLPLDVLLKVGHLLATGKRLDLDFGRISSDQLSRRLNDRSFGLLEGSLKDKVQFMHQTVKEFMSNGSGSIVMQEKLGSKAHQSGIELLLQYIIHELPTRSHFACERFLEYAHEYEYQEMKPAGQCIDDILGPSYDCTTFLTDVMKVKEPRVTSALRRIADSCELPEVRLMVIYVLLDLDRSLDRQLQRHIGLLDLPAWTVLLEAAYLAPDSSDDPLEILQKAGIYEHVTETSQHDSTAAFSANVHLKYGSECNGAGYLPPDSLVQTPTIYEYLGISHDPSQLNLHHSYKRL